MNIKRYKITHHSASALVDLMQHGVLLVRLCGPLTGPALLAFKAVIVERSGALARAYVADYSRAAIALDGAQLDLVLEGEAEGSAPTMPAALVVRPEDVDLFAGHAMRQALLGRTRQVFTDESLAMRWAHRYAEVRS